MDLVAKRIVPETNYDTNFGLSFFLYPSRALHNMNRYDSVNLLLFFPIYCFLDYNSAVYVVGSQA